jgi:hypothetical protein
MPIYQGEEMIPWLLFWSPHLYFPWSGSVAQRIEPNTNWFFDSINSDAGNGRIEKKAFDVASYGRQLGLLTEVLVELAEKQVPLSPEAATALARLKDIQAQIETIKQEEASSSARDIEEQVRRLKKSNPAEFARLSERLRPMMSGD